MYHADASDQDGQQRLAAMMGPTAIDQQIRQAIQLCWMGLPKDRRTAEEVEKQIRRLVDRALRDLRDDEQAFGSTQS